MKIGVNARKKRKGFDSNDNVSSVEPVRKKQKRQGKLNSSNEHAKKQNLLLKVKKKSSIKNHKKENNVSENIEDSSSLTLRRVNSIFYKLSKPGFPDSYLFGTNHQPVHHYPGLSNFHPEKSEGFKIAEQIFVENDHNNPIDAITPLIEKYGNIQDVFKKQEINKIEDYIEKFDLDETVFPDGSCLKEYMQAYSHLEFSLRPLAWLFNMMTLLEQYKEYPELSQLVKSKASIIKCQNQSEENKDLRTLDSRLSIIGAKKGKKVIALDTKDSQSNAIAHFAPNNKAEIKDLKRKIQKIVTGEKESWFLGSSLFREVLKANMINRISNHLQDEQESLLSYELQTMESDKLEKLNLDENDSDSDSEMIEHVFTQRNIGWMKVILPKLNISSFIGVGFGHLLGTNGLIKLFEREGFNVVPQECPRKSLPYERQFSEAMKELKSKSASILEHRFLKSVNSEHDTLSRRHKQKQEKSTSYLPGYQHQKLLKTVDKGIVIDKIDGVSMYRLV